MKDYKDRLLEENEVKAKLVDFQNKFKQFSIKYPNMTNFFIYKIYATDKDDNNFYDCDVLCEVLEKLVDLQKKDNKCFENAKITNQKHHNERGYKYEIICENGNVFRADTMNSFWTTFKTFLQKCMSDELGLVDNNIPYKYWEKGFGNNGIWIYHFCNKINSLIESETLKINIDDEKSKVLNQFEQLAKLTHTLGNFLIVPTEYINYMGIDHKTKKMTIKRNTFNCARSDIQTIKDNFDLTLFDIQKHFEGKESILIQDSNKHWFEHYDNDFKQFIDKNNLGMWVDENYQCKALFNSLDRENAVPQNMAEINEWLDNVIKNISVRNEKISEHIKKGNNR